MNNQFRIIKQQTNNTEILLSDDNPDTIFTFVNQFLSMKTDIVTMYKCQQNDECRQNDNYYSLIHWKVNDCEYILESLDDELSVVYLIYLPHMLFNGKTLQNINDEYLEKIIKLEPTYLCDLFVQKCMTDPFILLVNVFRLNEELIYQIFVHYLNQTIEAVDVINNIDLNMVVKMFFINNSENSDKYSKLFMKYLKMKQLMPFMIAYKEYNICIKI